MAGSDAPDGLAFDSNLLGKQTQRRLVSLWMETAGAKVLILPRVMDELCAPNMVDDFPTAQRRNAAHNRCWNDVVAMQDAPYAIVTLSDEEKEAASELMQRFTLRCFPRLNDPTQIHRNGDAMVLAQGIAAGVDCVVTNNMRSIDHYEINELVARSMGRSAGIVVEADRALLQAHSGGDSSRQLLLLAMASNWPQPEEYLSIDDAHRYVHELAERLARNVNMPNVADRLVNAFDVDRDMEQLLDAAKELSRSSQMLRCERHRDEYCAQGACREPELPARAPRNGWSVNAGASLYVGWPSRERRSATSSTQSGGLPSSQTK